MNELSAMVLLMKMSVRSHHFPFFFNFLQLLPHGVTAMLEHLAVALQNGHRQLELLFLFQILKQQRDLTSRRSRFAENTMSDIFSVPAMQLDKNVATIWCYDPAANIIKNDI